MQFEKVLVSFKHQDQKVLCRLWILSTALSFKLQVKNKDRLL